MGECDLISDRSTAALTSADGTVVWWCPVRMDADPIFTRLVDTGGACLGFEMGTARHRRYRDGTLLLETLFEGRESAVEVTDMLWEGRIVRRLLARRGPAPIAVHVDLGQAREVSTWSEGVAFDGVVVRCGVPFAPGPTATATTTLDTGESLVVTVDPPGSEADPLSVEGALLAEDRATRAWQNIAGRFDLGGRWAAAARRSALVVCAMGSPVPVLSPATSLPRVVGGERNRDGRIVSPGVTADWVAAARAIGLNEEADDAATWLAAVLDHDPPVPLVLALDGDAPRTEATLPMTGWRRSQPVLVGTNVGERRSVEPTAAVVRALGEVGQLPSHRLAAHADWLADHWADPDATVWGLPAGRLHTVAPWLAARRALDIAAADARRRNPLDLDAAGWHSAARTIERSLLSLPRPSVASDEASIVRVADLGPWPATDEVTRATLSAVARDLGDGGWVLPYPPGTDDGLEGTEPPSMTATLWLARALALAERWDEAHALMEAADDLAGPRHLLAESVDVTGRSPLGNRPSTAAHVAFIGAAVALAAAPA